MAITTGRRTTTMRWMTALLLSAVQAVAACSPQDSGDPPASGDEDERTGEQNEATDRAGSVEPADVVALPDRPETGAGEAFWEHWGDGKAELAAYRGKISRYGELRDAEVVLIYVTEPHDRRTWIKDDAAPEEHAVQVLKLNHVAKFRTGIYPYSVMTSTFAPVADWGRPRFQPVKIALTSQEWCGHVFHGIWPGPEAFGSSLHSYFAQEGDSRERTETPPDTLYEDALFIQLRELDGPFAGGESWQGHLVPRLWQRRKEHVELRPVEARIERGEATWDGRPVTRFTLGYAGEEVVYDVARDEPRRLLHWRRSDGTELALAGHTRLPYWELNHPGGEEHLEQLGIRPKIRALEPQDQGATEDGR